jgi:hypothetical protein
MAKCIKNKATGEVRRVSNNEAKELTSSKKEKWHYVPKSVWQRYVRNSE